MNSFVKLVIKKGNVTKEGKHTIFLQYCYTTTKRVLISTGIAVAAKYWDKITCRIGVSLPAKFVSAA
jgi:hypothetical protein